MDKQKIKVEVTYFHGKKEIMEFSTMKRLGDYMSYATSIISFEIITG